MKRAGCGTENECRPDNSPEANSRMAEHRRTTADWLARLSRRLLIARPDGTPRFAGPSAGPGGRRRANLTHYPIEARAPNRSKNSVQSLTPGRLTCR